MDNKNGITPKDGEIIIFQTPDGMTKLDVQMREETVWLTQQQMALLFEKDQSVIARHIQNVFREGELNENSNMQILHNTFSKYKPTRIYNLDVIISVGYRVKSQRGTQFRIWANRVLKEYLLRGYSINQRFNELEDRLDRRLSRTELEVEQLNEKPRFPLPKPSSTPVQRASKRYWISI